MAEAALPRSSTLPGSAQRHASYCGTVLLHASSNTFLLDAASKVRGILGLGVPRFSIPGQKKVARTAQLHASRDLGLKRLAADVRGGGHSVREGSISQGSELPRCQPTSRW